MNRSSFYYDAVGYSPETIELFNQIDKIYTELPYYGHRKVWHALLDRGFNIGRDRTLKYMQEMGIKPIYPKQNTSIPNKEHKVYPYLLRGLDINRPDQVWATDITYIRMEKGFCYLVAIIDWHSRYILSYRISTMLDTSFCIEALQEALDKYPAPEIFNTDQGCQFTSKDFTDMLKANDIQISMDGKGRAIDNIVIERFWRNIKYEDIYVREYPSLQELKRGVFNYMETYNHVRIHQSLDYQTPASVYGAQRKEGHTSNILSLQKGRSKLKIAV